MHHSLVLQVVALAAGIVGVPARGNTRPPSARYTLNAPPIVTLAEQHRRDGDEGAPVKDGGMYIFGTSLPARVLAADGEWTSLPDGALLWRVAVQPNSTRVAAISATFSRVDLRHGARLYVSTEKGAAHRLQRQGAGGAKRAATPPLPGRRLDIELWFPRPSRASDEAAGGALPFELELITTTSKAVAARGADGDSGACNVDTTCSAGSQWERPAMGVGMLVVGSGLCSGTLIASTAGSNRQLFLTAHHCMGGRTEAGAELDDFVFVFGHRSESCGGEDLPERRAVSGARVVACNAAPDACLLEISEPIPPEFNVFFNGWDARRNSSAPAATTGLHHPSGDVMKVSHDWDPPTLSGEFLRVMDWDVGTTEPGSSGSALFDPEQRVIGQLYGGMAACGNDAHDDYGAMAASFPTLRAALAPDGSEYADGHFARSIRISLDDDVHVCTAHAAEARISVEVALDADVAQGTTLHARMPVGGTAGDVGTDDAQPPRVALLPSAWIGAPGSGRRELVLSGLDQAAAGVHEVEVVVSTADANLTAAADLDVTIWHRPPGAPVHVSPSDGADALTQAPILAWAAVPGAHAYELEVAASQLFADGQLLWAERTSGTSAQLPDGVFGAAKRFYWRVRAINVCGEGAATRPSAFSALSGSTVRVSITPDNWPAETSWELRQGGKLVANGGAGVRDVIVRRSASCFTFVIRDTFRDGICCTHGRGSYQVRYDGALVGNGAEFGEQEKLSWCVAGDGALKGVRGRDDDPWSSAPPSLPEVRTKIGRR